jgi:hypothetical protein
MSGATVEKRVVDDRMFLLSLDDMYRTAMKRHERSELLACARAVASALDRQPAHVPVEGYYTEGEDLTEYFLLMRALQALDASHVPAVRRLDEYQRLLDVVTSPLYGRPVGSGMLLPMASDPLTLALESTRPEWTIARLTEAACSIARSSNDFSLVALASLTADAVVLSALRESVVLYAHIAVLCVSAPVEPRYVWTVTEEVAKRAARFVATFNALFDENLPKPVAANASQYWSKNVAFGILGRCVRIGHDGGLPPRHYHWAVTRTEGGLSVVDFWSPDIWTTERYRREHFSRSPF